MQQNEVNLVKTFVELLEQKNEKIVELSIVEYQNKINEVREEWNKKYGELENKYDFICHSLKKNGFISDEVKDLIGIEKRIGVHNL